MDIYKEEGLKAQGSRERKQNKLKDRNNFMEQQNE
jgi:hypothetical protein